MATLVAGALHDVAQATLRLWASRGRAGRVVLADGDGVHLAGLCAELTAGGLDVVGRVIDITAEGWAAALVADIGPVEHLLCAIEGHATTWDAGFHATIRAPWQLLKASAPGLRAAGGSYVALGAPAGYSLQPGRVAFSAAKAGLAFLVQAMAVETLNDGVRANLVQPGDAHETAGLIDFLLSAAAAGITGQSIAVTPVRPTVAAAPAEVSLPDVVRGTRYLVTGGAGAIARALCLRLQAERGAAQVVLVDLDAGRLAETAEALVAAGLTVETLVGSLADPALAQLAVDLAVARFGGLDTVFSHAAAARGASVCEIADVDWDISFDVNLSAAWRLAQASFTALKASGGSLVATASIGARLPGLSAPVYSASKAALIRLIEQLALEWAPHGVRANIVSPGSTLTPMNRLWALPEAERAPHVAAYPMRRMADPDEVAAAMAFIAGPGAGYITGHNLLVDGGLSLAAAPQFKDT